MKRITPLKKVALSGALLLALGAAKPATAHRIEYYNATGCITVGQPLTVDALVVLAGNTTYYNWQYKGSNGTWTCFVNGTNVINGTSYANVSGATGIGANNAPLLTIPVPTAALENVQVRCLMRDNSSPCATSSAPIWGGDDEALSEVKTLRLKVVNSTNSCSASCTDNTLTNTDGFYGGFEAVTYTASSGSFTDKNFLSGAGSTQLSTSAYEVLNNPYAFSSTFGKFAPHSGNYQMVVKGNTTPSTKIWYKTITVQPGAVYNFSAWTTKVDGTAPKIQLLANSTVLGTTTPTGIGTWQQVSGSYTVPSGTTSITFAIVDNDAASGVNNYSLDDICLVLASSPIDIGGKVWYDVNKNGQSDAAEAKVPNATVELFYDANGDNVADSNTPTQTTTSDANGAYTFSNVTPGKYFVKFTVPSGYTAFTTQTATGVATTANSDPNVSTGKTATTNFTSDNATIDAGVIKNLALSGNVYNDVNGLTDTVVNGAPISMAGTSQLYANLFSASGTFISSVAVASGAYAFSNLAGNTTYKIAVSTVQGTSSSTPASVLPALWINTGEFTGTGNGSDGTPDGIQTVALGSASIANIKFGIEATPAPASITLPSSVNPGGTANITVPASSFTGTDPDGTVSSIQITGFPTDVTSIRVKDTTYYANASLIPAVCPSPVCRSFSAVSVPASATTGFPIQTITIDPIDGTVTPQIPYKVTDNAGVQSANTGIVKVPVGIPDLTPTFQFRRTSLNLAQTTNAICNITNIGSAAAIPANGVIRVRIAKPDPTSGYSISSSADMSNITILSATPVDNTKWEFTDEADNLTFVLRTTEAITEGQVLKIGFVVTRQAAAPTANAVSITATIRGTAGGEVNVANNQVGNTISSGN